MPARGDAVFKLASDSDRDVVAERFAISRATSFLSFTGDEPVTFAADDEVSVSTTASDGTLRLLESQGHPRDWLRRLLASGRAFVCTLEQGGDPRSVCIAFENYRQIWEVGGVVTPAPHRGQGFATRVVRTALAELQRRKLVARYQVNEDNLPSIRLATSVGLLQFLQLTHFRTWQGLGLLPCYAKASESFSFGSQQIGVPYGIRTRVAAVKGRCPRPLDEGDKGPKSGSI